MRYIRFLKYPRRSYSKKEQSPTISSLITITSDLGETFCSRDVAVAADLVRDEDGGSVARKVCQWRAGMRNLQVDISIGDVAACPVKLHVAAAKYENADDLREYLNGTGSDIVSAWSETLGLAGKTTGSTVERRLLSQNGKTLTVREEAGESIARHIWYEN
ncbi:hypothetical protein GP486_006532 [Trichoglossum hirsutum]|uniref:Uncharacterized protein n=1 Tax=Trichoglossum hirsutum TaxID=265104 RepID=A0A9P8IK23_9PEZI|nr:hypothetical protein GP486_006532 [Trichoglossum hirsutum]